MAEFKPHEYQKMCISRIVQSQSVALFLEMGLGKTAITLAALDALMYDRLSVRKALIIAPKVVAQSTWSQEAQKWDNLKHLRFSPVMGDRSQRCDALKTEADIYIINRDNVLWLVRYFAQRKEPFPFDMVVIDELTSFKDPSTKRFKALKSVIPSASRVVGLTGTPAANGLLGMWAQMYLLDLGERLGASYTRYKARFFNHDPYTFRYTPKEKAGEEITERISDICVSLSAKDYLTLPDCIEHDIHVELDERAKKTYAQLKADYFLEIEGEEITATSAVTLTGKLLQLCGGAVYAADGAEVVNIHADKLEALNETLEALDGTPAIVFYQYKHERDRIVKLLTEKKKNFADVKEESAVTAWNLGRLDVLLAHPASAAFGLNLQSGGHHIIWYTLPWSLEQYQQANARLHRQGQSHPVVVHRLLVRGGMDETVAKALAAKGDTQAVIMEALKAERGVTQ